MTITESTLSFELNLLIGVILTNKPETSDLELALAENQVTSVIDLLALPTASIDGLEYFKDGKIEKVPGWATQYLVQLKSFIHVQRSEEDTGYLSYTFEDYHKYLIDMYNPEYPHATPAPVPEYLTSTRTSSIPSSESFKGPPSKGLSESEFLFYHIFKNVLKQADGSNIMKALEHADITDVFELIDLTFKEISSFQYFDEYGE